MPYYKFLNNDIYSSRIKMYPKCEFFIYSGSTYYNNAQNISGTHVDNILHTEDGHVSLYELNINRETDNLIYPFVTKDGALEAFKTVSTTAFNTSNYGDVMSASFPLSASVSKLYFSTALNTTRTELSALKNTLNYYTPLNSHYIYSSSITGDKDQQDVGLVSIPSIFYGTNIKKGSVSLKYYITGTLVGELRDKNRDGTLIEVSGTSTGSVAGVVLYNEGFILLTGSWRLSRESATTDAWGGSNQDWYYLNPSAPATPVYDEPKWIYFGQSMSGNIAAPSASFHMAFSGTSYAHTLTMLAHAPSAKLNHSNNPTYVKYGHMTGAITSSALFVEEKKAAIKNTISSSFYNYSASFEKQVFISKIGVYDKNRNLIGIAKVATPVRKREKDEYTFKIKLDI